MPYTSQLSGILSAIAADVATVLTSGTSVNIGDRSGMADDASWRAVHWDPASIRGTTGGILGCDIVWLGCSADWQGPVRHFEADQHSIVIRYYRQLDDKQRTDTCESEDNARADLVAIQDALRADYQLGGALNVQECGLPQVENFRQDKVRGTLCHLADVTMWVRERVIL